MFIFIESKLKERYTYSEKQFYLHNDNEYIIQKFVIERGQLHHKERCTKRKLFFPVHSAKSKVKYIWSSESLHVLQVA